MPALPIHIAGVVIPETEAEPNEDRHAVSDALTDGNIRMTQRLRRAARGFTLVEMLTSVAIIGLILVLIGYEFDASLGQLLHTQSNRDLEANARVIMTKTTNHLRTATSNVFGTGDAHQVIVSPALGLTGSPPGGVTSNVLSFYRVRPGSLANPAAIPITTGGVPTPPYDLVTIQVGPLPLDKDLTPDYLIETAVDAVSGAPVPSEPPLVLGTNVTGFSVTGFGTQDLAQIDISLTVASRSDRCNKNCSFAMNNSFRVGGDSVANQ